MAKRKMTKAEAQKILEHSKHASKETLKEIHDLRWKLGKYKRD